MYAEADLATPAGAKAEAVELVDYPAGDTTSPSPLAFAWPAQRLKAWGARAGGQAAARAARHPLPQQAQLEYYAERCPLLPQTLRFAIAELKAAKIDGNIARYAIAKAFDSRIAAGYEERTFAMAGDLVDGVTPDAVRAFRHKVLAAATRDDLASVLAERMPKVYGQVLPGYGPAVPDGVYFVIGPTKQLDAYQAYLRAAVGKDAVLHRPYPRDFWVPAAL